MKGTSNITQLFFVFVCLALLAGCTPPPRIGTVFDQMHERIYQVYGSVRSNSEVPLEDCRVVLVKRRVDRFLSEPGAASLFTTQVEDQHEILVALSAQSGHYSFEFEPLGANDIRLFFDARDKGFAPRFVDITPLMGTTIFESTGNSPLFVSVILEPGK